MARLAPEEIGLHSVRPKPGSRHSRKRVGRGEGSGLGKTSGRGHKGAGSRSGNRCSANRVPQNWQKRTSSAFEFPQRPHLIMTKGFAWGEFL